MWPLVLLDGHKPYSRRSTHVSASERDGSCDCHSLDRSRSSTVCLLSVRTLLCAPLYRAYLRRRRVLGLTSRLRVRKLNVSESTFPGNSLWTEESRPLQLRLCSSRVKPALKSCLLDPGLAVGGRAVGRSARSGWRRSPPEARYRRL